MARTPFDLNLKICHMRKSINQRAYRNRLKNEEHKKHEREEFHLAAIWNMTFVRYIHIVYVTVSFLSVFFFLRCIFIFKFSFSIELRRFIMNNLLSRSLSLSFGPLFLRHFKIHRQK